MNDDFLTQFRKSPSREFSAALYERINTPMITQKKFPLRRFTFAVAVCLAFFGALLFSPSARALLQYFVREIGGIQYLEEEVPSTPVPESQVTIVPEEVVPLAEAQAKLPYEIHLPTWIPEGFTMGPSVRISYFGNKFTPAYITWYGDNPKNALIELMVGQPVNWEVDLDHLQEIQINGEPASLLGGGWDYDTGTWTGDDATITWKKGDVMYRLSSPGMPVEDLIRIAESIP